MTHVGVLKSLVYGFSHRLDLIWSLHSKANERRSCLGALVFPGVSGDQATNLRTP